MSLCVCVCVCVCGWVGGWVCVCVCVCVCVSSISQGGYYQRGWFNTSAYYVLLISTNVKMV